MKLSADSIKSWTNLEKLFLARFFEDDTEVSIHTLLAMKQKKGESIKVFVERFRSGAPISKWYNAVYTGEDLLS